MIRILCWLKEWKKNHLFILSIDRNLSLLKSVFDHTIYFKHLYKLLNKLNIFLWITKSVTSKWITLKFGLSYLWFSVLITWSDVLFTKNFHQLFRHIVWFLFRSIISFAVFHCNEIKKNASNLHLNKSIHSIDLFFSQLKNKKNKWKTITFTHRSTKTTYQLPWNTLRRKRLQWGMCLSLQSLLGLAHNSVYLYNIRW